MPFATDETGMLKPIDCSVTIPGVEKPLRPYVMPDISEGKGATYADEPVIGRSFGVKTYGHSDNRNITMNWHVVIMDEDSKKEAIRQLNAFRSCVYPVDGNSGASYAPPPICKIECGEKTRGTKDEKSVCVVLKTYNVSFPIDVAHDPVSLLPYRFDISLNWDVVFPTSKLPGQSMIIT